MLGDKMKQLLSDPDAMARVMEMANGLFSASSEGGEGAPAPMPTPQARDGAQGRGNEGDARPHGGGMGGGRGGSGGEQSGSEGDRLRLLSALCPYLSPSRREAAMSMMRILRLMQMAQSAGLFKNL